MELVAGRYRLGRRLGEGGAGTVHAALDEITGAEVALKRIPLARPELVEAFRAELGALRGLAHPCLIRLLDAGIERGETAIGSPAFGFYTSAILDRVDLAAHARGRAWEDIEPAVLDALHGLFCLHRNRVVHGDVTPANILVRARGATLIDLSCARSMDAPPGAPRGTPGFMAPELLRGERASARSDLFALGRTLGALGVTLPPRIARLSERLAADDPLARPADLLEVFDLLDAPPPTFGPADAAPTLGRGALLAQLEGAVHGLARSEPGPRVLVLRGPPGAGRTRVLDELRWSASVRVEEVIGGRVERALSRLRGAPVKDVPDVLALLTALREARTPCLLVLDDLHRLAPSDHALVRALATLLDEHDPLLLVASRVDGAPGLEGGHEIEVTPLPEDAVRAWLGGRVPPARLEAIVHGSRGLPGDIAAALRGGSATESLELGSLSTDARSLLAELAVGARARPEDAGAAALEAVGLARFEAGALRLARSEHAVSLRSQLGIEAIRAAHERLAERSDEVERVGHWLGAGAVTRAEDAVLGGALDRGGADVASALGRATTRWDVGLRCARILEDAGRAPAAIGVIASLRRRLGAAPDAAYVRAAACQLKLSRPHAALRHLARADDPAHGGEVALERGRAHLQRGEYAEAEQLAGAVVAGGDPRLLGAAHELAGVALGYRGDARADAHLREAEARAIDPRAVVRSSSYRAITAYRRGALDEAAEGYARALRVAREHRLADQLPSAALNLATLEHRRGRFGVALALYDEARQLGAALGMPRAEASVRGNLAQLYLEIGAFDRSRALAASARALASRHGLTFTAHAAALIEAEVDLREGALDVAARNLAALRTSFETGGATRELAEASMLAARVALRLRSDPTEAIEAARRAMDAAGAKDLSARLWLVEAEREEQRGALAAAMERLERARARAEADAELDLTAGIEAALARVALALGAPHAAELHRRSALARWDRCAATLPGPLRDAFARHPDRVALRSEPSATRNGDARDLERILALSRDVARARDPERILELAMDAAIELLRAERGFVLLRVEGELEVAAARNIDREDLARSSEKYSRSIAERVVAEGELVLSAEAQHDERFTTQRSIHALRLRSVLCVPVRAREGVLGALYVDNRFEAGRFGEADARLLAGFADHVAIALTNARLQSELERRTSELETERHRIASLLDAKTRELERLTRRAPRGEGAFHGIVGRTPPMRSLFATLERVAPSFATVLIQGESGSGKELVARSLHDASPRRDEPFVAVNCGAIPLSLLESELFGHVRGAFTGAERERSGLFVDAGSGTLFLDEVGEMPEAMQVKLLRALEAREVRPVGASVALPFTARVVCATNRDLAREVREGRFREDLFYRLAVVVLEVPPLRARRDDIAWIARALVDRFEEPVTLTRDAVELLAAQDWPGNVRQLENTLRAASVFASGGRIDVADLRLAPSTRPAASDRPTEDEEARIRRALEEHDDNVSAVSRALGIPRMTLYRRLRAFGLRP